MIILKIVQIDREFSSNAIMILLMTKMRLIELLYDQLKYKSSKYIPWHGSCSSLSMHITRKFDRNGRTLTGFLLAIAGVINAQAQSADESSDTDALLPIVDLDSFDTIIDLEEDSVLPTAIPSTSFMGYDKTILDMPRSISTITSGQLDDKNINSVEDLDQLISGAYSSPIFGNIGVPFIRGDLGEVYQNGQRKAFNRNSFPFSFNGVEAVEAVKGAAPAVFGYGNATGGYLNLVTKSPYFDQMHGSIQTSIGKWRDYTWQVDVGGPLSDTSAFRISYEGKQADSFYRLVENASDSVYLAYTFLPSDTFSLEIFAEYLDSDFTEVPGTNRPTQALIDDGIYITGESISTGGSFFANTFDPTGTVRIDGSQILLAPGDGAYAKVFNTQAIATWNLGEGTLTNRTYYEDIQAQKNSSYYFFSHLPDSHTFENRIEYAREFETGSLKHQSVMGVSYRYEYRKSFVDIFNEYFNPFDVTGDPNLLRYPTDQLFGVLPVPGTDGFAVPGGGYPREGSTRLTTSLSATLNSKLNGTAAFFQDFIQLNDKWAVLVGTRLDYLDIESTDPLPRAGFDPISDTNTKGLWSGNVSLTYKPNSKTSYYLTANSSAAVESSSSSGGFGLNSNEIKDEVLDNSSELIEIGTKYSMMDDRLFAGAALYHQKRNRISPRGGVPDEIEIEGIEWDIVYQPNEQFNAGFIGTFASANYINGPASGTPTTQAPFDPTVPNSTFPRPPLADYRLPGLPRVLVNGFASYSWENGLGVSTAVHWQSEQNLDLEGFVVIPEQVQVDFSVFYRAERLELRLDLYNATDEFNWRPTSTPFAGADLVTRELPRRVTATATFKF